MSEIVEVAHGVSVNAANVNHCSMECDDAGEPLQKCRIVFLNGEELSVNEGYHVVSARLGAR